MSTSIIVDLEAADLAKAGFHCTHEWDHMPHTQTWQIPAGQRTDHYYVNGNADDFRKAARRLIDIANTIEFGEPHPID